MPRPVVATLVTALALACGACQGQARPAGDQGRPPPSGPDFITPLAGEPWTGSLKVDVEPPDGRPTTRWGRGSAQLERHGDGRARLVVSGAIDDEQGDAGFTVDGRYDAAGWKATGQGIAIDIAPDGRIGGGGTRPPQAFRFTGDVDATGFRLLVELELLEATQAGMPAGTVFRFDYDLARADPARAERAAADAQAPGAKDRKACRRIRYEMRPVANIGDGSMSMLRVPVCLD